MRWHYSPNLSTGKLSGRSLSRAVMTSPKMSSYIADRDNPECGRFGPCFIKLGRQQALYECTRRNLYTIRYGEPFGAHVDTSKHAVGHT